MNDGDFQTRQKNFCMKHLKNFGFGKKDFESVISEQATELVDYLEKKEGKMTINNSVFSTSAVNLIWSLLAGYSFDTEDPEIKGRTQKYFAILLKILISILVTLGLNFDLFKPLRNCSAIGLSFSPPRF